MQSVFGNSPLRRTCLRLFLDLHRRISISQLKRNNSPRQEDQLKELALDIEPQPSTTRLSSKDIFVNDLQATVDAHRASSNLSVLRKVSHGTAPKTYELFSQPISQANSRPSQPALGSLNTDRVNAASSQGAHRPGAKIRIVRSGNLRKIKKTKWLKGGISILIPLAPPWRIDAQHRELQTECPWSLHIDDRKGDGPQRSDAEIRAFVHYITPTVSEASAVQSSQEYFRVAAQKALPDNPISFHGSRLTGLALPLSDIDANFTIAEFEKDSGTRGPSPHRPAARRVASKLLDKLRSALRRDSRYEDVRWVHGRIPLVTAVDRQTKLEVQCSTLAPVSVTVQFIKYYVEELPSLRPLYLVLRQALELRGLKSVPEGGLGSYSLLTMITTALKHYSGLLKSDGLGQQLLFVLEFWGNADLIHNGYCPDPTRVFPKQPGKTYTAEEEETRKCDLYLHGIDRLQKYYPDRPYLLCLQDPANPVNDLGRQCLQIREIQTLFRKKQQEIGHLIQRWDSMDKLEREQADWTILDPLLRANYRWLIWRRRAMTRYQSDEPNVEKISPSMP
ncbi:hypothetical protein MMC25_001384 [Agyrium rufum]|nr:hypothetical protein [Agyrium rufum]